MAEDPKLYKLASGDIAVWLDDSGAICIKTVNKYNDPVELAEHEALELADLLSRLVEQSRTGK